MGVTRSSGQVDNIIQIDPISANESINDRNIVEEIKQALIDYRDFYRPPSLGGKTQGIPEFLAAPDYLNLYSEVIENNTQIKPNTITQLSKITSLYKKQGGIENAHNSSQNNRVSVSTINGLINEVNDLLTGTYCWTANTAGQGYVTVTCTSNSGAPSTVEIYCNCNATAHTLNTTYDEKLAGCGCNAKAHEIACYSGYSVVARSSCTCHSASNFISCQCDQGGGHNVFCGAGHSDNSCFINLYRPVCSPNQKVYCNPVSVTGCRPNAIRVCSRNGYKQCNPHSKDGKTHIICNPHNRVVACEIGDTAGLNYNNGDNRTPDLSEPIGSTSNTIDSLTNENTEVIFWYGGATELPSQSGGSCSKDSNDGPTGWQISSWNNINENHRQAVNWTAGITARDCNIDTWSTPDPNFNNEFAQFIAAKGGHLPSGKGRAKITCSSDSSFNAVEQQLGLPCYSDFQ